MTETSRPLATRFGEFELFPNLRRLERNGAAVEVSSRAMDILCLLIERSGDVVGKREILERVWPDVVVDEGSVRFHVAALRRALGDGESGARFIATVAGRGYCFVGVGGQSRNSTPQQPIEPAVRLLRSVPSHVVGREEVVTELTQRLDGQRFVTVVGAGGIGKTTVALMAAHRWAASRDDPVTFVDLGALGEDTPEAVAEALGSALGLAPGPPDELDRVVAHLRSQSHLIVLDTCEAATEGAARVTEALFAEAPGVRLLATSREALRAEGEWVYRIEPLAAPKSDAGLSAEDALGYPAVQLFVHRAAANHAGFELRDEDAPVVSAICRDLDGMALAIELAAGRVDAYGVRQVADLLSTEFALTWPGRRTAAPRQQTLNATLNWSHELLSDTQRAVFRRLSVFVGGFSLEAALSVAMEGTISLTEAIEALSSLVAKSLLSAETDGARGRYRMLDTTRAYARAKLAANGEEAATHLRHAEHYLRWLGGGEAEDRTAPNVAEQTTNLRAALEWAFGPIGEATVGVGLAAAASPFWLRHGLLVDARRWAREALSDLDRRSHPRDDIDAHIALVSALTQTEGLTPEIHRNSVAVYDSALRQGRPEHQLIGLLVLWTHEIRVGRYRAAQRLVDQADVLEGPERGPAQRAMADYMVGLAAHCLGDQRLARQRLERFVDEYSEPVGASIRRYFGHDVETTALRLLSLVHFLLGNFDQARAACDQAIAKAQALGYPLALAEVRFWRGFLLYYLEEDTPEGDALTFNNVESARINRMDRALGAALVMRGLWMARRGDVTEGAATTLQGFGMSSRVGYLRLQPLLSAELALQLARHRAPDDRPGPAVDFAEEADPESWCTPEILRIKGEIAERDGDPLGAEMLYRRSLVLAERQGALTWQLRAANGLADLWIAQKRPADAAELLAPLIDRFELGREQPDLRVAAHHLEVCRKARAVA